ncbi:MAG: hypothetical protein AB1664_15430 [Thermodesulfobacteriota bacterium]
MIDRRGILRKLGESYRTLAIIVLNTLLVLILVNLVFSGVLDLKEYLRKRAERKAAPYNYRTYNDALAPVYPGMTAAQVNQLLDDTRHVTLGYQSYTQFKERPFKGTYVNADDRGFRPIKDQGPWPPDKKDFTIFVFGGSTVFGYGVPDYDTIASHLQDLLAPQKDLSPRVYNFGRCSYISIQERILLEKLILGGTVPRMVIFIDGLNDLAHYDGEPALTKELTAFMNEGEVPTVRKVLRELPMIKTFLGDPKKKNGTRQAAGKGADQTKKSEAAVVSEVLERYRSNKRLVEAFATPLGITPVFVWQPMPVYGYDQTHNIFGRFDYQKFTPYVKPGYEAVAKLAASGDLGENFIWCGDIQRDKKEPLYVDAYHYSGKMSRMIASHIVTVLKERKLLP